MSAHSNNIAIIGAGTIGLSFSALHLSKDTSCSVRIYDTRSDLEQYIQANLPGYLSDPDKSQCLQRITIAPSLDAAVSSADIVQEQGPENAQWKQGIWPEIEQHVPKHALLWSSTSGIPASTQSAHMKDPSRLCVVHPYNPPHIMPLLEVVPSPSTSPEVVQRTLDYWRAFGREPVVIQKECTGFVANRLAFALFREACSLVAQDVISVEDLDKVVESSMGPRWAVGGPFKSYHAGGGESGLAGFMEKIGGAVQGCWDASEKDYQNHKIHTGDEWQAGVCDQAHEAYGKVHTAERDSKTRAVLAALDKS